MICLNEEIIDLIKRHGFNFVTLFPCGKIKTLYNLILNDNQLESVELNREEEGLGVCTGAYLGGKTPFMLIQSTGLANSLNAVFSLIKSYKIPLLILTSYRGVYKENVEAQRPLGENFQEILTAAHIPHYLIKENLDDMEIACSEVRNQGKLVVCLLSPELFER